MDIFKDTKERKGWKENTQQSLSKCVSWNILPVENCSMKEMFIKELPVLMFSCRFIKILDSTLQTVRSGLHFLWEISD